MTQNWSHTTFSLFLCSKIVGFWPAVFVLVKSSLFSKRFIRHALKGTANNHSVIFESAVL